MQSKQNILIDIGHPAHVHYLRNLSNELSSKGNQVFWTVKEIEVAKQLLNYYGFKYTVWPKKADGLLAKAIKQLIYDIKMLWFCKKNKIDL